MKKRLPRFLYGFLSASSSPINMSLPWQPSDNDGLFKMNRSIVDAERDSLILWAHTNKGERVYDFEFGLDARRYLFEPENVVADVLSHNARTQLSKYFPHLVVEKLEVLTPSKDNSIKPNSVRLILIARPKNSNSSFELSEVLSS